jgi:hypothetical protein
LLSAGAVHLVLPAPRIKASGYFERGVKRWISLRSVTVATTDDADVVSGGAAGIAAGGATAKDQRY